MGATPSASPRPPSCARWVFVAATGFYLATGSGLIHPSDGAVMFHVTESLSRGRIDIDPLASWPGFGGMTVTEPATGRARFFAKYGLGLSLAALPLDVLGRAATPLVSDKDRALLDRAAAGHKLYDDVRSDGFGLGVRAFFVSGTNALVVGLVLALLFRLLIESGFGQGTALAATAIVAAGTPLWEAARNFFSEPLGALGLVGALLYARRSAWLKAGALLGVAVLAKPAHLVLAVPLGLLAVLPPAGARAVFERGARFAAGTLAVSSIAFVYDFVRFGNPLETGYGAETHRWTTPFLDGLKGLLLSPGRGFLLYAPLWLLAIPTARALWRRDRGLALVGPAALLVLVLTYARWHMWEGGWCWGPRFLLPIVPWLAFPVAEAIDRARASRPLRVALVAVVAVSVLVAWSGTRVDANDFSVVVGDAWKAHAQENIARGVASPWAFIRSDWGWSPLVRYWTFSPARNWLLPLAVRFPGLILACLLGAAVTCVASVVRLVVLTRSTATSGTTGSEV